MWGGWKLFYLHKNQLNALFLSFLVKTRKDQQKWTGFVFRSRFCISVVMSQRFILSFFVLAPTHNVNVRVTLLLPAPSSTQPKHCFDQLLKCASTHGYAPALPGLLSTGCGSCWCGSWQKEANLLPHLQEKSHKFRSEFKVTGYHGNISFLREQKTLLIQWGKNQ